MPKDKKNKKNDDAKLEKISGGAVGGTPCNAPNCTSCKLFGYNTCQVKLRANDNCSHNNHGH